MPKQTETRRTSSAQARVAASSKAVTKLGRVDLIIAASLTAVTLAIYAQVIGHEFINLDDDLYIKENAMVNRGLSFAGLAWAFTTFHASNWHPLTWIAHMVDSQIFGLNAGAHLVVSAIIHAANALLVFWLFRRATGALWPSALVAALFALHPLHVESVAWVAERKDILATFFGLLSLILYCRYVEAPSATRYAWTAATLALGLMAKPMLVTWPFVMLLLDYWPLRRMAGGASNDRSLLGSIAPLVREKLPLFCIVAASAVITVIAQTHGGAVRTFEDAPIWLRLSNAVVSYAKYLLLTFWPNNLAVYYPFVLTGMPAWHVIGAALLIFGLTVFCFVQAKRRPYLPMGWFWFLGTLIPVIGIVQVGGQTMADRYHYVPSIGLFVAIVFGVADVIRARCLPTTVAAVIAGVPLLALMFLTNAQLHLWRNSVTLFRHTLAVTPPSLIIETNFGLVLGRSGNYDEAAVHFERALQIKPDFFDALLNMGITLSQHHRLAEAVPYFQRAISIQPESAKPHLELGLAYANLNDDQKAREELEEAARLDPQDANARANLGLVFLRLRKVAEAMEQLHEALRLDPNSAEAHNNLGIAFLGTGRARESIPEFEAALRLKPTLTVANENLRRARAKIEPPK